MMGAAEIAQLGVQVAQTFTAEATIFRLGQAPDNSGGFTDTYTAAAIYPCAFGRWDASPIERESQPRVLAISGWRFVFAVSANILTTDRLAIGSFPVGTALSAISARMFEIVDAGVGSADTARKVTCLEIT